MLANQEITFMDSIMISLGGMAIVMIALIIIALFVLLLSKTVGSLTKEAAVTAKPAPVAATPAPVAPVPIPGTADDELAVVMAVVIEESGHQPEEILFKSITKK